MDSMSIAAISGNMSDTRQGTPYQKKLPKPYYAFLDEETATPVAEDDQVELSDEGRVMQQADGYLEKAA